MGAAAEELENLQEKMNWHWRYSMRTARFFAFDARAAIPMPVLLFYPRLSTVIIAILTLFLFRYLERKGLTFPAAVRTFRQSIVGTERPAWIGVNRKKFTDWG